MFHELGKINLQIYDFKNVRLKLLLDYNLKIRSFPQEKLKN